MTRKGILVSVALFVTLGNLNAKDELAITELYGLAVHAYFDGEYQEAHKALTDAIELGTDDPRVFYFRGLSKMKLGREDEAKADFESGGKLEASGPAQFYPIGRSLERIQGSNRMAIEKVRKQARIAIRLRKKKIEQARIEVFKRDERMRKSGSAVQLGSPSADSKSDEDPFGTAGNAAPKTNPAPNTGGAATPAKSTTPATPAKNDDPFGTPKKATEPAGNDPFATPKKATEPAGNDPFGTPKKSTEPAGNDPFGTPKKSTEPAGNDPFGTPKKSTEPAGNDPFGTPKKSTEPAGNDPFGTPKKSTEPAGNDPFGTPKKSTEPAGNDPFGTPKKSTEPAGNDPFGTPKKSTEDANDSPSNNADPFAGPSKKPDPSKDKSGAAGGGKADDDPFK